MQEMERLLLYLEDSIFDEKTRKFLSAKIISSWKTKSGVGIIPYDLFLINSSNLQNMLENFGNAQNNFKKRYRNSFK